MNPYGFIVGCPRSGTTLLRRIGDAHPQLAIVHETRWIARTFEQRRGLTSDGLVTPRLLERLLRPNRLKSLQIGEAELRRALAGSAGVHFSTFVTGLFDRYGEREGKALVGDKSPGYVRYLPTLHELWPQAKFVHIIRDGRDVCLSVLDWGKGATRFATFEDDPFTTIGVWWEWYVRLGREGGIQVGHDLYHEVRYESLVVEPEQEIAQLCEFLGIPFDPSMLRFFEGRTKMKPGLSTKSSWLPVTPGLRSWRQQMDPEALLQFEAAAGGLLDELGYPRAEPSIPRKQLDRAAQIREAFVQQAHSRKRPLPQAWSHAMAAWPAEKGALGAYEDPTSQ